MMSTLKNAPPLVLSSPKSLAVIVDSSSPTTALVAGLIDHRRAQSSLATSTRGVRHLATSKANHSYFPKRRADASWPPHFAFSPNFLDPLSPHPPISQSMNVRSCGNTHCVPSFGYRSIPLNFCGSSDGPILYLLDPMEQLSKLLCHLLGH